MNRRWMFNARTCDVQDYELGANGIPFYFEPVDEREWVTGYEGEDACIAERDAWRAFRGDGRTLKQFFEQRVGV